MVEVGFSVRMAQTSRNAVVCTGALHYPPDLQEDGKGRWAYVFNLAFDEDFSREGSTSEPKPKGGENFDLRIRNSKFPC
jgi:hypothetical protein